MPTLFIPCISCFQLCYPSLHPDIPSLHPPTFLHCIKTTSVFLCIHTLHFLGFYSLFFHLNLNFFISFWFLMLLDFLLSIQMWALSANVGTVCLCGQCISMFGHCLIMWSLSVHMGAVCLCGHCIYSKPPVYSHITLLN